MGQGDSRSPDTTLDTTPETGPGAKPDIPITAIAWRRAVRISTNPCLSSRGH